MITKERIDELIQQRAKIWGIGKQGNVFCIGLKFRPHTLNNKKWLENKYEVYSKFFETKEEAEWVKEFGDITRTERLVLPTWEEWQKDDEFDFLDKEGFSWDIYIDGDNQIIMANGWKHFIFENNKEGYFLACRKAKELFLGEEECTYKEIDG